LSASGENSSSATGRYWESIAAQYLREQGLTILERGYRCRLGELDIICRDESCLVIVEVRARASAAMVSAISSIGHNKRNKIIKASRHYLMRHPQASNDAIRFDVITIEGIDMPQPELRWIRGAFDAS